MKEDIWGQKEGRQPAEQAHEPSSKQFLLARLKRKGEGQPAASKAGARGRSTISVLSLARREGLAQGRLLRFTVAGSGGPLPTKPPPCKLPVASCLVAQVVARK